MTDASQAARFELAPADVRRRCDPAQFPFETTAELQSPPDWIGQQRALDALAFGVAMDEAGYNLFVSGLPGTGRTSATRQLLHRTAATRPVPSDWCYVHNFKEPGRPRALQLPPGQGRILRDHLRKVIQAARREIPRTFESEEYIARREAILGDLQDQRSTGLGRLQTHAQASGFALQSTELGFVLVPVMGNRPLTPDQFVELPADVRGPIERRREQLEEEMRALMKEMRAAERQARDRSEAQDREVALQAVGGIVDDLMDDYEDQAAVRAFLEELREGILADIHVFRSHPLPMDGVTTPPAAEEPQKVLQERAFRKYDVNVVVDNGGLSGAPVVFESNPTYGNLIGRIEHEAVLGALLTDFNLIAAGALHRANGGYLMVRAEDLLPAPMAWEGIKRALRERAILIEEIGEKMGLASTRGLRPDPIPLDAKVVLIGDPAHFYLLYTGDPDFRELFKVRADFDTEMERNPASEASYASFVGFCTLRTERPADREAVARVIEESSRLADDQRKLSARFAEIADLVKEANYWAEVDGAPVIGERHVARAVEQRFYRSSLVRDKLREMTGRGVLIINPAGEAVGQIHGLAVTGTGDFQFGRPTRITATVGAGRDGLLDIERQAELGGKIHSKGVLILGGYLNDQYAHDRPLALSARIVFEQSYSEVEGDSASLAELLALLSRLADVPLKQSIAVTGSVNQRGDVQAVGGLNEKIEGFFDTCTLNGLTGDQGVLLPASNVESLMLRPDVVAAVAAGTFHVYAVRQLDDALTILSGRPAAEIHEKVHATLQHLADSLRDSGAPRDDKRDSWT